MIQLKVYNSIAKTQQFFIDLYETEPIKLTLSIEDITNTDATSTFSKTFKVPGTRANAQFFKNSFDVDGTLFDVTVKKPAEILVDGAEFKQGQVRLQRVYLNTDLDRYDYELIFLGETRDFSSKIGDRGLCELQLPDLIGGDEPESPIQAADIIQSWNAFPQTNDVTAGLHNGNIIFPLINHGNTYVNSVDGDQSRIATTGLNIFTEAAEVESPLTIDRFKPMIRAKRIWDQIFEDAGYTYTSDFIESNLFHQMYISAFGNEATVGWDSGASSVTSINVASANSAANASGEIGPIFLPSGVNDPGGNLENAIFNLAGSIYNGKQYTYYTVPASGEYLIKAEGYYAGFEENSDFSPTPIFEQLNLYRFPVGGGAPQIVTFSSLGHNETLQFSGTFTTVASANFDVGDELVLVLGDINGNSVDNLQTGDFQFEVAQAPGDFNPVSALECVYKQIDFIKDILTAFRLVLSPDPNDVQNFIVEPWQEYINSGELYDWSHKLVQDKDFVIEPVFYTQSAEIDYTFAKDGDYGNVYHELAYKYPYGYLEFNADNDLLIGKREVKLTGIAPTIITNVEGTTPVDNFNMAQLYALSQGANITQQLPIKARTRFLFYNGLQPVGENEWLFAGAVPEARTTYPLVSPYQQWPIAPQTLNLNWFNDIQYWGIAAGLNQNGTTLWTNYWSRYLNFLYGKFSRRVTAYFILNNVDLNTFSFDDTIFINGTYYRPEKIIDLEVGAFTQVKVQLLTSNDFKPAIIPFETLLECSAVGVGAPCASDEGSITVTTNGTPGFTFQLSNGQSGEVLAGAQPGQAPYIFSIPNIAVGTYTLIITDSLGRTKQLTVTIPVSSATLVVATHVVTPASDCNICDGAITVTPSGGTAPYTIEWNDGATAFTRTGLCPGAYSYIVTDFLGCAPQSYFVEVPCEAAPGDVWRFFRSSNDCQQIFNDVRFVFFPVGTAPTIGSFYDLGLIGGGLILGCWTPTDIVQETANAIIIQAYDSCDLCNDLAPSQNFLMVNCLDGSTEVVASVPGVVVGQVWELLAIDGCFVVDSISDSAITTATLATGPYVDCDTCLGIPTTANFDVENCATGEFSIAALPTTFPNQPIVFARNTIERVIDPDFGQDTVYAFDQILITDGNWTNANRYEVPIGGSGLYKITTKLIFKLVQPAVGEAPSAQPVIRTIQGPPNTFTDIAGTISQPWPTFETANTVYTRDMEFILFATAPPTVNDFTLLFVQRVDTPGVPDAAVIEMPNSEIKVFKQSGALVGEIYKLSDGSCWEVIASSANPPFLSDIAGPFIDCDTCEPPQDLCVTNFGASMAPCIGGTLDEFMEGYVQLSGPAPSDLTFTIEVGYGEGTNFNCANQQVFEQLFVNIEAGQDFGILDCSNGAPFISFQGATICTATLSNSPLPLCEV